VFYCPDLVGVQVTAILDQGCSPSGGRGVSIALTAGLVVESELCYDYDDLDKCPACGSKDLEFDDEWCYCCDCDKKFYCPSFVPGSDPGDPDDQINRFDRFDTIDRFDLLEFFERDRVGGE